jgi:hypothetical protein
MIKAPGPGLVPGELSSATGTFLSCGCSASVVFAEVPQRVWEFAVGSWWLFGVTMQIGAGLIARPRPASKAVG